MSASQTAFVGHKRRQFYLSHLPAYFSDINKRAMLASPLVCTDMIFAEADLARLLADTQMSSSLWSQQALVDVAFWGPGARRQRFSPNRSPSRSSPSRRRCRDSGSPGRQTKRVQFDSPAPSSALKSSKSGYPLVPYPHTYIALYFLYAKVTCNTHKNKKLLSIPLKLVPSLAKLPLPYFPPSTGRSASSHPN